MPFSAWNEAARRCSRPEMLGIMAGLDQKDSYAVHPCHDAEAVFPGGGMFKAGIADDNAPRAVFAGMRRRLFGVLCIGTGPGGHVHRDMTPHN